MRLFNFNKKPELEELERRVNDAKSIEEMQKTDGWKLIESLFSEQLEAYKAELLLGCENWEEYRKKQSKAFAIRLLLTDIEDYLRQGAQAAEELEKFKR